MEMNEVTELYKQEQWDKYDKGKSRMSENFMQDSISNEILAGNPICNPRT